MYVGKDLIIFNRNKTDLDIHQYKYDIYKFEDEGCVLQTDPETTTLYS